MKFGVVQEITIELSDPLPAKLMQTDVGMTQLKNVRVIHDPEARPAEYISVTMTPERSRMLMDIPAETVNTLSDGHSNRWAAA